MRFNEFFTIKFRKKRMVQTSWDLRNNVSLRIFMKLRKIRETTTNDISPNFLVEWNLEHFGETSACGFRI